MSCIDSNGAEVYAMLMGCRELRNLGGHDAIIKGDSFCAIQWGSPVRGQAKCPWRVADLVEEIQHISASLRLSFNHVSREANDTKDSLVRVGAFS